MSVAETVWNKVRGDSPKYSEIDPDFRARLDHAEAVAREGNRTDIAGLEKFEDEMAKAVQEDVETPANAGSPRLTEGAQPVAAQPEGSGAQEGTKGKALEDAAAAGSRVEASGVNSPPHPSAARPVAAESPANRPRSKGAASKSAAKGASKSAAKSSSKKSGTKSSAKKSSK
jgi:hypothetical protein